MKFYAVMLAVLWAMRMFISMWAMLQGQHPMLMLNHALDLVVLTLAMAGAVQLGFGKVFLPRFTTGHWRMVSRGTLLLGALSALLYTHGEAVGVPPSAGAGLMQVALIFLPYLLFAIPVTVLEHELRKTA